MVILGTLGLLGILVSVVMLVISLIKKNGKAKVWGLGIVASIVVAIVGITFSANESTLPANSASAENQPSDVNSKLEKQVTDNSIQATIPGTAIIDEDQLSKLKENMTYDDFIKLVGVEGELVYDREGVKTYSYFKKESPEEEVRVAFENGKLMGSFDEGVPDGGGEKADDYSMEIESQESDAQAIEEETSAPDAETSGNVVKSSANVGEKVFACYRGNGLEFVIISINKYGTIGEQKAENGVFWVAELGMANFKKEALTVDTSDFVLVDSQENEYETSTDAELELQWMDKKVFSYQTINPKMSYVALIPFLVPQDVEEFSLKYKGALFEGDIIIPFQAEQLK